MSQARKTVTELFEARLDRADLGGAFLIDAKTWRASFKDASLAGAFVIDANLSEADLAGVDFARADLTGAILDGANLTGARNLAQAQLDRACGDDATRLPEGLTIDRRARPCVPGLDYLPCRKPLP